MKIAFDLVNINTDFINAFLSLNTTDSIFIETTTPDTPMLTVATTLIKSDRIEYLTVKKLYKNPYDVVHFRENIPCAVKGKAVLSLGSVAVLENKDNYAPKMYKALKSDLEKSVSKADLVIVPTVFAKDILKKHFPKQEKKFKVVGNGADMKKYYPVGDRNLLKEFKESHRIHNDYFLSITDITATGNIENLLEAYALLRKEYTRPPSLVILGKLSYGSEEMGEKIKKASGVRFLENIPDLNLLINGSRALIEVPSYSDNGETVLKAMACGVPVMLSDIPVYKELFTDKAIFAFPNDVDDILKSMKRLMEEEPLQTFLSQAGYETAERSTWEENAKAVYELYRGIL